LRAEAATHQPRQTKKRPSPRFTTTLGFANPLTARHPLASRIDGPRKRSHLNANNALIARATRGRSHRIELSPLLFLPAPHPVVAFLPACSHPFGHPFLRHFLSSHGIRVGIYDLCPQADVVPRHDRAPNVSRSSPSRRVNDRRRAATTYNDRRPRWLAPRHEGDHFIFMGPARGSQPLNGRRDVDRREIIKSRNDDLSGDGASNIRKDRHRSPH